MLPIQAHKLLQMERAWWNSCLKWGRGCVHSVKYSGLIFFYWKLVFFFFFGGWGGCHGNKHGGPFFLFGHFVYGVQCVVWVQHVSVPQFLCLFGARVSHKRPDMAAAGLHSSVAQREHKLPTGVVFAGQSAISPVINTCSDRLWIKEVSFVYFSLMRTVFFACWNVTRL